MRNVRKLPSRSARISLLQGVRLRLFCKDTGHIRDWHSDLRLDHVYFMEDIQIIDCIEFNERFRYGDVAADLAFLAMDLDYHGCSELGLALVGSYVQAAEDPEDSARASFGEGIYTKAATEKTYKQLL